MKLFPSLPALAIMTIYAISATAEQADKLGLKLVTLPANQAEKPGLTHEEWLEYLTLNSTEGWEPLSRVPQYTLSPGELLDLSNNTLSERGLVKRAGGNVFKPSYQGNCQNTEFGVQNFDCGICVTAAFGLFWQSSYLWRQTNGNPYPTADWYNGYYCSGTKVHHQGILSGQSSSCDDVRQYDVNLYGSAMLYQGC